jgi:hypothetical protein
MNAESVSQWLAAVGVPAEVVSIGTEADQRWCLLRTDDGSGDGPAWEVFWREQGNRYDWASFTNEQVACFYLFGRLSWTQVARGAVVAVDAAAADASAEAQPPQPSQQARPGAVKDQDPDATPPFGIPLPPAPAEMSSAAGMSSAAEQP